ncbi:hypothetical protein [Trichormus sp. NMC-1]|uniref:hypothetical protein n=1 Tax=Trichormus sp. NMC-1 TaxID=1853259 RepID=UPI001F470F5E|nr:hypothetical protein [Trichormus sp. NMC-1]
MLSTGEIFNGAKSYKKYEKELARMQYLNRHKQVGSHDNFYGLRRATLRFGGRSIGCFLRLAYSSDFCTDRVIIISQR